MQSAIHAINKIRLYRYCWHMLSRTIFHSYDTTNTIQRHSQFVNFSQSIPQIDFLSWESISNIVNFIHRFHFHRPVVITPVLRPSFVRTWSFQSMENESWHGTSLLQVATVCMTNGTFADAPVRYSNHWCNQRRTSGTGGITTTAKTSTTTCLQIVLWL